MKREFSGARTLFAMVVTVTVVAISLFLYLPRQSAQGAAADPAQVRPFLSAAFSDFEEADAVTSAIRRTSTELVRVTTPQSVDKAAAAKYGRIVADYGPFVIIAKGPGANTGISKLETQKIDTTITLPGLSFDTLIKHQFGTVGAGRAASENGKGYYVVQFGGIATDRWLDGLRDAGLEILQYVPNNAFFVYGDGASIERASRHSRVRWVGAFLPEHKITEILRSQIASAATGAPLRSDVSPLEVTSANAAIFDVAVFSRGDLRGLADVISNRYGGTVIRTIDLPNNYFKVIRVELALDRVLDVADIPDVITIDRTGRPEKEDERAAQIVAGNYSSTTVLTGPGYNPLTQFGVDGTNVTVSMVDDGVSIPGTGGFYLTSANTVNGPLCGAPAGATGGHGHLNASIIAGNSPFGSLDPTGYNYGLGVAPKANIINIPMLVSGYAGSEADAYNDTITTPGPNGSMGYISNNSWGNGLNSNVYDAYTAQFDGFVRDATAAASIDPVVLVFSAGNSGPGALSLTRPKASKNMIAVGNSENIRTELGTTNANNIDDLRGSSSRGPTADGRVKPDIIAPGSYITGSRAGDCSSVTSCFDTNHAYSIGTSHAAPQVAGAAALFTQFWRNSNGGANPSPALVKAAVINTAQEMNGSGTGTVIPNGNEGWGRINMRGMLPNDVSVKRLDQSVTFNDPGNSTTFNGIVSEGGKPIRVTLAWTDPPGAPNANPALVNDLNLTVTVGTQTFKGNVFVNGVSAENGVADTLNNVENVFLPIAVQPGTPFTITVSANTLNGDGVLGNADTTDQNFALVAYNFSEVVPRSRADFDGDGKTDISVFRPSEGNWYLNQSTAGVSVQKWGLNSDVIVPGDYDFDGKADLAIFRAESDPTKQDFYVLNSGTNTITYAVWGMPGDVPITGDFDGDFRSDFTVFRPAEKLWYTLKSSGGFSVSQFGAAGDIPMAMDFDGDRTSNLAVFRPANKTWYIARPTGVPSQNFDAVQFGLGDDIPVPADYDGDGKDDVAVFRPSNGIWFVLRSSNGLVEATQYGLNGDIPVPGDYDGDGRDDLAVYRGGMWFLNRSVSGGFQTGFGLGSDVPVPNAYIR